MATIGRWQQSLWRFTSVGHIGKVGGPKAWQEPVDPARLAAGAAAEAARRPGPEGGHAVPRRRRRGRRQRARLRRLGAAAARRAGPAGSAAARRARASAASWPRGASRCSPAPPSAWRRPLRPAPRTKAPKLAQLAQRHGVEPTRAGGLARLSRHRQRGGSRHGRHEDRLALHAEARPAPPATTSSRAGAPATRRCVAANSSDQHVRIPGNMKPHGVAVHPSPTLHVVAGWRSPVAASDAHRRPRCSTPIPSAATA